MANKGTSYITDPNTIPVTSSGGDVERTLEERFSDVVNVKDFGATGDGVTDDSAAIQAALDYITSRVIAAYGTRPQYGGVIYFPEGEYLLNSQISYYEATNRDVYVGIKGASSKSSVVLVDNPDGFIRLEKTNYGLFSKVDDLQVVAAYASLSGEDGDSSGTAFEFRQFDSGNRRDRHVIMNDVIMSPKDASSPVDDHWDYGVRIYGGGRPYLFRTIVYGLNSFGRDREDTWVGQIGFDIFNCYGPILERCGAWGFNYGCSYDSDVDPGPEGGHFVGCTFDSENGLYINTPSVNGEPGLTIRDTHCNAGTTGITIAGRSFVHLSQCVLYNETATERGSYTDIYVERGRYVSISDVMFQFEGNTARTNIRVGSASQDVYIRDTVHHSNGTGIVIESGADYTCIQNPSFRNVYTTRIDDQGGTDVHTKQIQQMGCSIGISAGLPIADGAEPNITFDVENYDYAGWFAGPSETITVPTGRGIKKIRFSIQASWGNNSTGWRKIRITKNGSDFSGALKDTKQANNLTETSLQSLPLDVEEGDVFRVRASQGSGSTQTLRDDTTVVVEVIDN